VLSVGLSATDYVGHSFGTGGVEMCLQLLALDRELGDFFRFLDRAGLDYAVALTSDHGGQDIPERLRLQGVQQAARVDKALGAAQVGKQIAAKLGLSGPVLVGGYFGDVYIDPGLKPADRARALREALAIYRAHPQVEAAYSADELQRTPLPTSPPDRWTMLQRARAAYDPARSGELVVLLRRFVTPIPDTTSYVATHGSPWDYDRRVPILFWRKGMAAAARQEAVDTVDIMPTLAAMLGLAVDHSAIDGKCLGGIAGIVCPQR
jgi:arylsulfatase A-like enzyme